jgi:hypothetical protein
MGTALPETTPKKRWNLEYKSGTLQWMICTLSGS